MFQNSLDPTEFEKEWKQLCVQICQAVYVSPKAEQLKEALKKKGFLSPEEVSEFIEVCDRIKYEFIYEKYGDHGSEGYLNFSKLWQKWFESKGVSSQKDRGQRNSVDHILFGSTPDPVEFLTNFEKEVLHDHKH
jgi:hypothetical protein